MHRGVLALMAACILAATPAAGQEVSANSARVAALRFAMLAGLDGTDTNTVVLLESVFNTPHAPRALQSPQVRAKESEALSQHIKTRAQPRDAAEVIDCRNYICRPTMGHPVLFVSEVNENGRVLVNLWIALPDEDGNQRSLISSTVVVVEKRGDLYYATGLAIGRISKSVHVLPPPAR